MTFKATIFKDTPTVELALRLRMATNGSADPWPAYAVDAAIAELQRRLDNWAPSTTEITRQTDEAFRAAVMGCLAEVRWQMNATATDG